MEDQNKNAQGAEDMVAVVDIQFRQGQKVYYFDPADITCKIGDHVIIDTARGPEYGICVGGNHFIKQSEVVTPLRSVLRIATAQDEKTVEKNAEIENRATEVCQDKVRQLGLDMQLVSAECAFDGSKILFFFTADDRVDFRELVKSLASTFHTRIEMRQIGVRDKAKMVGGLGICGRPFCCASFLDDFQPVSIKMAKTQNLSLNPTKISGACGKLMCCLKYEQAAYEDLISTSPKQDSFVDTPDGRGTVVELDLLHQRVKVRMENQPEAVRSFANSEIAVLRSGKAKKNDPPIPADLAPISGAGRQAKKAKEEDEGVVLERIRFRYSTETIAEETVAEETPAQPQEEKERKGNNRSRRRNRGGKGPKQTPAEGKKPQEAASAKLAEAEGTQTKVHNNRRRRPNHRRHRPGKPNSGTDNA